VPTFSFVGWRFEKRERKSAGNIDEKVANPQTTIVNETFG
jgi:hypothetical protein